MYAGLNVHQHQSVISDANATIILAGPGKTKVITTRVAHLVKDRGADPSQVVVVTFTNRAAEVIRERTRQLLGPSKAYQLLLGTFHSICLRFLRSHGTTVGLRPNFSIADRGDSVSIVKKVLLQIDSEGRLKPESCLSLISSAKAANLTYQQYETKHRSNKDFASIVECYKQYQETLLAQNMLDFDDLLMYGAMVMLRNESLLDQIRYVLVDEFQDTSAVQYQLTLALCSRCRNITAVGDPDQTSADVGNMQKLRVEFPTANVICLQENYRSTKAILRASDHVIAQDTKRPKKTLFTANEAGHNPIVLQLADGTMEARLAASEIMRLVKESKGFFTFADFAILVRTAALTRVLEAELWALKVPFKIIGGLRFFDRQEVKDIVAYLRLCANSDDNVALERIINKPARGVGASTIDKIIKAAAVSKISHFEMITRIVDKQDTPDMVRIQKKGLDGLVKAVRLARKQCLADKPLHEVVSQLIKEIGYADCLRKSHPQEADAKLENLDELINYTVEFEEKIKLETFRIEAELDSLQTISEPTATNSIVGLAKLQNFLENVTLVGHNEEGDTNAANVLPKVTISTLHSAKGLEWPVVLIMAAENGQLPHTRSVDRQQIDEERRLLYVGMTRAKVLLYITCAHVRTSFGQFNRVNKSPFLECLTSTHTTSDLPPLTDSAMTMYAKLLSREKPVAIFPQSSMISNQTFQSAAQHSKYQPRHEVFGIQQSTSTIRKDTISQIIPRVFSIPSTKQHNRFGTARTMLENTRTAVVSNTNTVKTGGILQASTTTMGVSISSSSTKKRKLQNTDM